jgi:chromosome segregation ATPase
MSCQCPITGLSAIEPDPVCWRGSGVQEQAAEASFAVRGLRAEHEQGVAGLVARVSAVEERVARGCLSVREEREGLERKLQQLDHAMTRVEEDLIDCRARLDARPSEASPSRAEAMRRLEQRVLEYQEQIQHKMAAIKQRFEQPIEGFLSAVNAISEDLEDVKRRFGRLQER